MRVTDSGVTQFGARDLLRDVQRSLEWWEKAGRPTPHAYGVTVTPAEQTIWLGGGRTPVPVYE